MSTFIDAVVASYEKLETDEFWGGFLRERVIQLPPSVSIHLAVFVEPFLQHVLDGKKTVESRFSVNQTAPYGCVNKDDVLLLKEAGGPVVGICLVSHVWSYNVDVETLPELRSRFAEALCAQDSSFWNDRADSSFATLMRLTNVRSLEPISVEKRDRRGWVVIRKRSKQLLLWND